MPRRSFLIALLLFLPFVFSSCTQKRTIEFDTSDPRALTPGLDWAVVTDPYAAFRAESSYFSSVKNHARAGDIMEVKGKYIEQSTDEEGNTVSTVWYEFDEGWIESSSITIYSNKLKAQTASAKLLSGSSVGFD